MENLWNDAKYGTRMLIKSGALSAMAVLTLARCS
jgi:hypothetical protein